MASAKKAKDAGQTLAPLKILYVSSEAAPFAKTGGLADVAGSLPSALSRLGHDVRLVIPGYASIDRKAFGVKPLLPEMLVHFPEGTQTGAVSTCRFPDSGVRVYLIEHADYFGREGLYQKDGRDFEDNAERFAFFCVSSLWLLNGIGWQPDVIVCNDWQTALIPTYLRTVREFVESPFFSKIRLLFTIHNLAFQGLASPTIIPRLGLPLEIFNMEALEFFGHVNVLKGGILYSDKISTVSPRYAEEIQTEEFGCGLDGVLRNRAKDVIGILNGIDTQTWSPMSDDLIPQKYSVNDLAGKAICKAHLQKKSKLDVDPVAPLIGVISRLTDQKGFDLIAEIIKPLMKLNAQFVLLGTGEKKYHYLFERAANEYPGKIGVHLTFDNQLAHEIEAGADMFLMPSRFEPCGLNQMYSMNYGTIPIARKTGGLADSITDAKRAAGTGFLFEDYSSKELLKTVERAIKLYRQNPEAWAKLIKNAMSQDFSWDASAKKYEQLLRAM